MRVCPDTVDDADDVDFSVDDVHSALTLAFHSFKVTKVIRCAPIDAVYVTSY